MSKDIYTGVEGEMNSCKRLAISDPIIVVFISKIEYLHVSETKYVAYLCWGNLLLL